MSVIKAHVENGRIVVDDPTDLPEGTVLRLVAVKDGEMSAEERAQLEQSIEEGYADFEKGDVVDAFEHLGHLRVTSEDSDRRSPARPGRTRT